MAAAAAHRPTLAAARGTARFLTLAALPLALVITFAYDLLTGFQMFDYWTFWQSGVHVLHGVNPYPEHLPQVAHQKFFRPFVYPAPAAVAMAPLALLPFTVASLLWGATSLASLAGALWLLGVRDWRCYSVLLLWAVTWSSLTTGSISPELLLLCAALWRFRSRPVVAGGLLAALVVCKLYLWPIGIWLLVTRRIRAAVWSVVFALVATLGGWAVLGFAGLREYPHLVGRLAGLVGAESYSPFAFVESLGGSAGLARIVMFALGALVVAAVAERGRRPEGDASAYVLAIAASLVLSPIVWPHYLVLVCVAMAVAQPTFGRVWLVPIALYVPGWSDRNPLLIGGTLLAFGLIFAWSVRRLDGARPLRLAAWPGRRRRALPASPSASPS